MNQIELAERLGRPQSYVSKVERLERRLDIGEWRAMAIAIGLDPAEAFAEACGLLDHIELLTDAP
jgi:transcriptional regulator with XRE-family HTH domain